jgi:hypothetical protein
VLLAVRSPITVGHSVDGFVAGVAPWPASAHRSGPASSQRIRNWSNTAWADTASAADLVSALVVNATGSTMPSSIMARTRSGNMLAYS